MSAEEHFGHRKRLDEKSELLGFEFLEEHEQLEKILFAVIPRGNTNEIAHGLLERCGSLYGVLTAETEELCKVPGVGTRVAQFLRDLYPLLGCVQRCKLRSTGGKVCDVQTPQLRMQYAKTLFYGKLSEVFYLVSLNKKMQAVRFDKIAEGSAEEIPVYVKDVVKQALKTHAYAVMLCHNHPAENLCPSGADIEVTHLIAQAMEAVGIVLCDHIIVGGGDAISMKELGAI